MSGGYAPAPKPPQVEAGRRRIERGERAAESEPRPFFCRSCGAEEVGMQVPTGWYSLVRAQGAYDRQQHRLGLYCSLACLEQQLPRLAGIERDLGADFSSAPSAYKQVKAW